jgi:hypothetical protein
MGAYFDIALSTLVVIGAAVFLLRRFRAPKPPSCAPNAKSQPQVILGSRLAKALETQRLGQR